MIAAPDEERERGVLHSPESEVDTEHRLDVIELALGHVGDVKILIEDADFPFALRCRTIVEDARSIVEVVLSDLPLNDFGDALRLLSGLLGGKLFADCRFDCLGYGNLGASGEATAVVAGDLELVDVDEAIVLIGTTFALNLDVDAVDLKPLDVSLSRGAGKPDLLSEGIAGDDLAGTECGESLVKTGLLSHSIEPQWLW